MSGPLPRLLRRLGAGAGVSLTLFVGGASSCTPIVARPLSNAPVNVCSEHPCDLYEPGARVSARCTEGRCEIPGRPEYRFWIVVHVSESSFFAPGSTFVLASDVFTKTPDPSNRNPCKPPQCLLLPSLRQVTGAYEVGSEAAKAVGYGNLPDLASIPVEVVFTPLGPDATETYPALPLEPIFVSSALFGDGAQKVQFARVLPPGRYARVLVPEPPFDQYFPPHFAGTQVISTNEYGDRFRLDRDQLDDVDGTSRDAVVTREEGLAGWRAWLVDRPSQRRISTVAVLDGTEANVTLRTTNEVRTEGGGLGDDVEAIVAPPDDWTAVPRLVSRLLGGVGLKNLAYPSIPPPVPVTGVIAEPGGAAGGTVLGYAASVSFRSESIATLGEPSKLLRYATSVHTDDKGRFSTVLPPGTYRAIIEPSEGTGFAKTTEIVVVERAPTAFTLRPPRRTLVTGKALLSDERPLGEAEVMAIPAEPPTADDPRPRPGRGRTELDGRFTMELDPGLYNLAVVPKAGTGFPRTVIRSNVPAEATELPDIRVPAPTRLTFVLKDPSPVGNPIVRAVVRIFAEPEGAGAPVEIGSAMSDLKGNVDILLPQQPR